MGTAKAFFLGALIAITALAFIPTKPATHQVAK